MADVFTKQKRSEVMSKIRSKNTKIELKLRKALQAKGLVGYRVHYNLSGKPDIAFPSKRIAIFVDGDFWHGWNWKKLKPKLKNEYWVNKIIRNMQRDKKINRQLSNAGWKVLRLWEHDIIADIDSCAQKIEKLYGGFKNGFRI